MDTPASPLIDRLGDMDFAHRLAAVRKQRGLTQQTLADTVGIRITQIRRYEAGTSQPTLDVLRALAIALSVSTDALVFNEDERGPTDNQLRLRMEALERLDDEKTTVIYLIESVLLRHDVRRRLTGQAG